MRRVTVAPSAQRWFIRRVAELADLNPAEATKLIAKLEEVKRRLAMFPDMTERSHIKGTRKISMPPYILILRQAGDQIEIISIRHARQRDALKPRESAVDGAD